MAASTRVPDEVPRQDHDVPALGSISSAELIFTIVYSAARRVDWLRGGRAAAARADPSGGPSDCCQLPEAIWLRL